MHNFAGNCHDAKVLRSIVDLVGAERIAQIPFSMPPTDSLPTPESTPSSAIPARSAGLSGCVSTT